MFTGVGLGTLEKKRGRKVFDVNRKAIEIRKEINVNSLHVCYGQESKNVHMQLVPFDSNNHANFQVN